MPVESCLADIEKMLFVTQLDLLFINLRKYQKKLKQKKESSASLIWEVSCELMNLSMHMSRQTHSSTKWIKL